MGKESLRFKNNTLFVNLSTFNEAYEDVIKVRDFAIIVMKSDVKVKSTNRIPSSKDVEVHHSSGEIELISRKELCDKYVFVQNNKGKVGTRIRPLFMKANTPYRVMRQCNEPYKAVKVPSSYIGIINGKRVRPGDYVVCKVGENGDIIENTSKIISSKEFRKSFIIPMNDKIQRAEIQAMKMGANASRFTFKTFLGNKIRRFKSGEINRPVQKPTLIKAEAPIQNNEDIKQGVNLAKTENVRQGVSQVKQNNVQNQSGYLYNAVARITRNGELIGYVLIDRQGSKRKVPLNQVKSFAYNKKIKNIELVKDMNNIQNSYLRGNGISLTDLPEIRQ